MTQKIYETYEQVNGMEPCIKKPIVVHAKLLTEPSRVKSLEGDYKQGKAGDYLIRGIDGELYICDGNIFLRTYDFIDGENNDNN